MDEMQRYVESEFESLEPFDFVAIAPGGRGFHMVEVCRGENHELEVRVPGRPPFIQALSEDERSSLLEHGFASEDPENMALAWVREAKDAGEALEVAREVIHQIFGEKQDIRYDVFHGSHRAEHEAKQKLAEVRIHVESVITEVMKAPPVQDEDGDYLLALGDVQVVVAPRSMPGGPTLVRVFTVTNVGITATPDLGLMLSRLNFNTAFGRFSIDAERNAILFDETLLGDPLNQEALRFAIDIHDKEPLCKPGQGDPPQTVHGLYL